MKKLLLVALLWAATAPVWGQTISGGAAEEGAAPGYGVSAGYPSGDDPAKAEAGSAAEAQATATMTTIGTTEGTAHVSVQPQTVDRVIKETKIIHEKPVVTYKTVKVPTRTKIVQVTRTVRGRTVVQRIYSGPTGVQMNAAITRALRPYVSQSQLTAIVAKINRANEVQDQRLAALEGKMVQMWDPKSRTMQWFLISDANRTAHQAFARAQTAQATADSAHQRIDALEKLQNAWQQGGLSAIWAVGIFIFFVLLGLGVLGLVVIVALMLIGHR